MTAAKLQTARKGTVADDRFTRVRPKPQSEVRPSSGVAAEISSEAERRGLQRFVRITIASEKGGKRSDEEVWESFRKVDAACLISANP